MDDPDMVLRIDRDADRAPEQPVVGQRLRPHRIDLKNRHLRPGLLSGRDVLKNETRADACDQRHSQR